MTDKNPHLASNRLIAAAFEVAAPGKPGECVIGMFEGNAIVSLRFEEGSEVDGKRPIRAICAGTEDTIVEICEAWKFEDLHDHLINKCQIAPARAQHEFSKFLQDQAIQPLPHKERFLQAEEWNKVQEAESSGLLNQFEASGLMYSIVHNAAYRIVDVDHRKDRTNPEFFTVYVQNAAIADPEQCLVTTDSFDTVFEALGFIRTHIEQRLFKAFMPELLK